MFLYFIVDPTNVVYSHIAGSSNENFIGKALSVFHTFFNFVDNFSNFFSHKNYVWTTTRIYKKKISPIDPSVFKLCGYQRTAL